MIIVAFGKMRQTWNYMAKLEHRQAPIWVRASGKMVWFITYYPKIEIYKPKNYNANSPEGSRSNCFPFLYITLYNIGFLTYETTWTKYGQFFN